MHQMIARQKLKMQKQTILDHLIGQIGFDCIPLDLDADKFVVFKYLSK